MDDANERRGIAKMDDADGRRRLAELGDRMDDAIVVKTPLNVRDRLRRAIETRDVCHVETALVGLDNLIAQQW